MNNTHRPFSFLAVSTLAALLLTGCESHYTTQEAYDVCTDLTDRNPATNPPETFLDCVGCYEACGDECIQNGTAPATFVCPDELDVVEEDGEDGSE